MDRSTLEAGNAIAAKIDQVTNAQAILTEVAGAPIQTLLDAQTLTGKLNSALGGFEDDARLITVCTDLQAALSGTLADMKASLETALDAL